MRCTEWHALCDVSTFTRYKVYRKHGLLLSLNCDSWQQDAVKRDPAVPYLGNYWNSLKGLGTLVFGRISKLVPARRR